MVRVLVPSASNTHRSLCSCASTALPFFMETERLELEDLEVCREDIALSFVFIFEKKKKKKNEQWRNHKPVGSRVLDTLWGNWFWNTYLSLAANLNGNSDHHSIHPCWLAFLFRRSFGSTGPCEHCCKSHRKIVFLPQNNLDTYVLDPKLPPEALAQRLVRWMCMVKYQVNTKLNKPIQPLDLIEFGLWRDPEFTEWWADCFFNWLYCQAIMFP